MWVYLVNNWNAAFGVDQGQDVAQSKHQDLRHQVSYLKLYSIICWKVLAQVVQVVADY